MKVTGRERMAADELGLYAQIWGLAIRRGWVLSCFWLVNETRSFACPPKKKFGASKGAARLVFYS